MNRIIIGLMVVIFSGCATQQGQRLSENFTNMGDGFKALFSKKGSPEWMKYCEKNITRSGDQTCIGYSQIIEQQKAQQRAERQAREQQEYQYNLKHPEGQPLAWQCSEVPGMKDTEKCKELDRRESKALGSFMQQQMITGQRCREAAAMRGIDINSQSGIDWIDNCKSALMKF